MYEKDRNIVHFIDRHMLFLLYLLVGYETYRKHAVKKQKKKKNRVVIQISIELILTKWNILFSNVFE